MAYVKELLKVWPLYNHIQISIQVIIKSAMAAVGSKDEFFR